ncbi:MAG: hypothetical protein ACK2UO_03530 [Caldilineaceae bacterium]
MGSATWVVAGDELFCPIAVCPAPGRIVLFARDPSGRVMRKEYCDGQWTGAQSLGIPVAERAQSKRRAPVDWQLGACFNGQGRLELFGRSPDGALVRADAGSASALSFEYLGAPAAGRGSVWFPLGLSGPPAACPVGSDRIDVFALGQGGDLLHVARDDQRWGEFESLGTASMHLVGTRAQPVPSLPIITACANGNQRVAVFLTATVGALLFKWWDGRVWSDFVSLGMPEVHDEGYPAVTAASRLTGAPAACSWGPSRLDVFARGPRGELLHKAWDGRNWSSFLSLWMPVEIENGCERSVPLTGAVTACSWGKNRVDVFATALNGKLYHAWWDGRWKHD